MVNKYCSMRILLFDPFSGAAGDMVVGSLLAAGADRAAVVAAMTSVVGPPTITEVTRCGIRGLRVETHATPEHRTLEEVMERVAAASAPATVKEMAIRVFERIHRAEASLHTETSHFHEVGADDAIADVVGACMAFHTLGVDGAAVRPIHLGKGFVQAAHGTLPVPSPATVAILKDAKLAVVLGNEERELCTPTGAALLAEFSTMPEDAVGEVRIASCGYGAGMRDPSGTPNVLRSMVLTAHEGTGDCIHVLETNVDDVTGEVLAYAMKRMMEAGARDVSAIPLVAKKGRTGYLVRAIVHPESSEVIARIMSEELGTLGVRCMPSIHRYLTTRSVMTVEVEAGGARYPIDVKAGWKGSRLSTLKAEYEQVRACAEKTGMRYREVALLAEEKARLALKGKGAQVDRW
jgi:uncharacterized protein (TIGR00299 family) protein